MVVNGPGHLASPNGDPQVEEVPRLDDLTMDELAARARAESGTGTIAAMLEYERRLDAMAKSIVFV